MSAETKEQTIARLTKAYRAAARKSEAASEASRASHGNASPKRRASIRVRWARAAESRDLLARQLQDLGVSL